MHRRPEYAEQSLEEVMDKGIIWEILKPVIMSVGLLTILFVLM